MKTKIINKIYSFYLLYKIEKQKMKKTDHNLINKISWSINRPVNTATFGYDDSNKPIPIPTNVWKTQIGIRKGDRVVLVYHNREPQLLAPVRGKTLRDLFESIERGMKARLNCTDDETTSKVYPVISRWYRSKDRLRLVNQFEKGKLTAGELCGDYVFFDGNLKRENGGIWTYALGN
jgi:hypothetical protein